MAPPTKTEATVCIQSSNRKKKKKKNKELLTLLLKEDTPPQLSDMGDTIDQSTFEQILEMDDDDTDRDFSKGIVYGFFDQAESTFDKMETAM